MKKTYFFFLVIVIFLCLFSIANAGPEEVKLIPQSRYSYKNVGGYGFYEKCTTKSWFAVILQNTGSKAYTVSLPSEVRIGGWSGTRHPIKNTTYKKMTLGSLDIFYKDWKEVSFSGDLKLPANSQYALFMDITNIGDYDLYWDTDVFFKITVKDGSTSKTIDVQGVIAQRGNACPPDQVCSAQVKESSYAANGSGQVIVRIKNNMPDSAPITAKNNVDLKWTDANGKVQTRSVENGVTWKKQPGTLTSGTQKDISGTLTLPADVTSAARQLTATFYFFHPSSLNFGDFNASTTMTVTTGVSGTLSGNYSVAGAGTITGTLNNHLSSKASVTLPKQGTVTAKDGTTSVADFTWSQTSPLSVKAGGSANISGKFTIRNTAIISGNSSLVISADFPFTSGGKSENGVAAGTVTRDADPNAVLVSAKFCKSYTSGSKTVKFSYTLRNDASIDMAVQLATTMAISGQSGNLPIKYTKCMSGGSSCMARVSGFDFTIKAGESAEFSGEVALKTVPSDSNFSIETSLIYNADGKNKALWVGKVTSGCVAVPVTPKPTTVTPKPTTATPKPTTATPAPSGALTASAFCRTYKTGDSSISFSYTLKNTASSSVRVELAKSMLVQGRSDTAPVTYTGCTSSGSSCMDRISGYDITLKAGETAVFSGKVTLGYKTASAGLWIQTSLIYTYNSRNQALYVGRTANTCNAPATSTPAPSSGALSVEGFCRNYTAGSKTMTFTYVLKNKSSNSIPVQLATTLLAEGQDQVVPITYTGCQSGGASCMSRVSGNNITLKAGEMASFSGKVTLVKAMSKSDIYAQTSLIFTYNNKNEALFVGRTTNICSVPVTVTPATVTPVTSTPAPASGTLSVVSFCRNYTAGSKALTFTYSLKNKSSKNIPVELATTLLVEGQGQTVPITYTACSSGGSNCMSRISGNNITLKAGETASFSGKATLVKAMSKSDIYAQTSLIYTYNNKNEALFVGRTTNTCSGSSPATPVPTAAAGTISVTSFCRDYKANSKTMTITYGLKNSGSAGVKVQLAQTLLVQGNSSTVPITYTACSSGGSNCMSRISGKDFTLKAGETAVFTGTVTLKMASSSSSIWAQTSLIYDNNGSTKALYIGRTTSTCTTGKDVEIEEIDTGLPAEMAEPVIVKDISEPDPEAGAPILNMTVSGAGYSACGDDTALRFIMYIRNDGMTAGTLDLNDLVFSTSGAGIPVHIATCAEMSGFGTDSESCQSAMADGIFSVIPGITLRLEGIWDPQTVLRNESILISAASTALAEGEYSFEAFPAGSCGPDVEILSDPEGKRVQTDTDPMDGRMTLSVKMVNSGFADEQITPGTVYIHNDSLETYRGTGTISSDRASGSDDVTFEFISGQPFSLPAGSDAVLRLTVDVETVEKTLTDTGINWNLSVGNENLNLLGSIEAAAPDGGNAGIAKNGTPERDTKDRLQLFVLDEPELPARLPSTGFPTHGPVQASVRPGHIVYQQLQGLHLEIPTLSASMDVVGVPLDENGEWAVTWLGDKAGILDGMPLPGKGTAVIAAHNHLNELEAGPFVALNQLEARDRIFITDANGRFLTYRVYANELVSPAAGESIYDKAVPGSLVLLTCEQELPEGGYAYRRAVYAEPLQ